MTIHVPRPRLRFVPLLLVGCGTPNDSAEPGPTPIPTPPAGSHNILVVVADDLGVEKLGSYGLVDSPPPTPTLDQLASEGMQFDRAWAYPVCSPSRAAMLTGRHAFRTGMGRAIQPQEDDFTLSYDEWTIPEMLGPNYTHAALGKWHLSTWAGDDGEHPMLTGFDTHAGSLANFKAFQAVDGQNQSFYDWEKSTHGMLSRTSVYATTDTTDDAIDKIGSLPEPWFLWVAYNAAHDPYHAPPPELHTQPEPVTLVERYDAMIEAMDTEMGRLFAALGPERRERTTIIFIGDNGTPREVSEPPLDPDQVKHSVFEGGIKVPLIIAGPDVSQPGGRTDALVNLTDLYATVAELAGVPSEDPAVLAATDSVSLVPWLQDPTHVGDRQYVYAERYGPNGSMPPTDFWQQAIRDDRWKLHVYLNAPDQFFDLGDDWFEGDNLLTGTLTPEQADAYDRLSAELVSFTAP